VTLTAEHNPIEGDEAVRNRTWRIAAGWSSMAR
jgi:hypothetical protein